MTAEHSGDPPIRKTPLPSLRILLVEDHASTREALEMLLELRRHRVTAVASIAKAIAAAEGDSFDVVISDVGLPDGSGYELMTELGRRFGLKGIAFSGYDSPDDLKRSREAGFLAHIAKPMNVAALDGALALAASNAGK